MAQMRPQRFSPENGEVPRRERSRHGRCADSESTESSRSSGMVSYQLCAAPQTQLDQRTCFSDRRKSGKNVSGKSGYDECGSGGGVQLRTFCRLRPCVTTEARKSRNAQETKSIPCIRCFGGE